MENYINMKKSIIIILVVVIAIGIGIGIYFYLKSKKIVEVETSIEGKILETVMESPKFSADKKWVYFYSSQQTPAFYRTEISSKKTEQISSYLADIEEIKYSPDLSKVGFKVTYIKDRFEKYGSPFLEPKMDEGASRFWVYNFENKKLDYLNQNIISYTFSPDSKKIFYVFLGDEGKISINQADYNGNNYEKIIDWQYGEPALQVIDDGKILLAYSTEEYEKQGDGLYLLDTKNKKLSTLTDKDFSTFFSLSPNKKQIFNYMPLFENNKPKSAIWITDINAKDKFGYLKTDDELDYQNIIWSSDNKTIYLAGKPNGNDNFTKLYQYQIDEKKLNLVFEGGESNFEAVEIDNSLLYYLLNSQLYAAKIQ